MSSRPSLSSSKLSLASQLYRDMDDAVPPEVIAMVARLFLIVHQVSLKWCSEQVLRS